MTDLRQAATLALDALTYIYTDMMSDEDELIDQAITAIKEALAQPPLPEQEPLEYWNAVEGWVKIDEMRKHFDLVNCGTIYRHGGEGRVPLYTAPPQQKAEPVAWDKPSDNFNDWWDGDYEDPANPFEKDTPAYWAWAGWKAAQTVQEPVAWLYPEGVEALQNGKCWTTYPTEHEDCNIPLYTASPQRPWVRLTEQERNDLEDALGLVIGKPLFDAIEAALKEHNHG